MNALDLVKAAKSATGDFADFWKNFVEFSKNLPNLFKTFGDWDQDRINNIGLEREDKTGYIKNTRDVFAK